MIEPVGYPKNYLEPSMRSTGATEHMPFRFAECGIFLTKDSRFKVILPGKYQDCFDSFTVDFPDKGDISILYFIFDKDINGKVLPFIEENFITILKKAITLQQRDAVKIAKSYIENIQKFDIWVDK